MADYVYGSAVPKRRPVQRPNQRQVQPRVIEKSQASKNFEARAARKISAKLIAFSVFAFAIIGAFIMMNVQLDELGHELTDVKKQIEIVDSENTRMNMALSSDVSLGKVEEYAKNDLGMVKVNDYQVNYVNSLQDDKVKVNGKGEKNLPDPEAKDSEKDLLCQVE